MKSSEQIKDLFNNLARQYDFYNRYISFGFQTRVKKKSLKLLKIKNSDKILDICTGTGDLAYFINKINSNTQIIGVDFSKNMLDIARKKQKEENIKFFLADGRELPFEDNSFDIVTIGFGLRNIENYERVIEEIRRVLRPNGQFLNIDFSCEDTFFNIIFDMLIELLTKFSTKKSDFEYLIQSKSEFLNTENLINFIRNKDFIFLKRKYFCFGIISSILFRNNK